MATKPLLQLYTREGCVLCEDFLEDLQLFQAELGFDLQTHDIDDLPALRAEYHTLVPMLTRGNRQICHYYLDPVALRQALAAE